MIRGNFEVLHVCPLYITGRVVGTRGVKQQRSKLIKEFPKGNIPDESNWQALAAICTAMFGDYQWHGLFIYTCFNLIVWWYFDWSFPETFEVLKSSVLYQEPWELSRACKHKHSIFLCRVIFGLISFVLLVFSHHFFLVVSALLLLALVTFVIMIQKKIHGRSEFFNNYI